MEKQNNLSNLGELSVGYKYHNDFSNRPRITNNIEEFNVINEVFDKLRIGIQEQFVVAYLNQSNCVIGTMNLFSGNINSTAVDIKIIVAAGLKLMASAVLVGHNHPSNSLTPSKQDIELTQKLKSALEFMDMRLLDHIIVSPSGTYLSFIEQGQL